METMSCPDGRRDYADWEEESENTMNYIVICQECGYTEQWTEFQFAETERSGQWQCGRTEPQYHTDPSSKCFSRSFAYEKVPTTTDDVKVLRAEYNERHKDEPGFVPSVEYVMGPDGKTRPRES